MEFLGWPETIGFTYLAPIYRNMITSLLSCPTMFFCTCPLMWTHDIPEDMKLLSLFTDGSILSCVQCRTDAFLQASVLGSASSTRELVWKVLPVMKIALKGWHYGFSDVWDCGHAAGAHVGTCVDLTIMASWSLPNSVYSQISSRYTLSLVSNIICHCWWIVLWSDALDLRGTADANKCLFNESQRTLQIINCLAFQVTFMFQWLNLPSNSFSQVMNQLQRGQCPHHWVLIWIWSGIWQSVVETVAPSYWLSCVT